ncbi:MAG: DUF2950 domain-containing protein [Gammaproteobacteria bacterium]|nr:DUF2950 domain-containing protein [Gammaproteobacteria bacterium]
MKDANSRIASRRVGLVAALTVTAAFVLSGCARNEDKGSFKSPEDAVDAFIAAVQKDDMPALQKLLGPGSEDLLSSGDPVQDNADRERFLASYAKKHSLEADGSDRMTLVVGDDDWPFPVPLAKQEGKWHWDGAAGADEVVYRRIGRNELGAIAVSLGFVDAQKEYASEGRDGDPAGVYALKLVSDEGMHNGLYWPTTGDEPPSPAGPFVAAAADEGYRFGQGRTPYHGYYYRMLYSQGPHAQGGAKEYFADGVLTQGFALVAWPADYGASGVQTFIVNQDGVVYQKDLGEDTATVVETITSFDPDDSWKPVQQQDADAATS